MGEYRPFSLNAVILGEKFKTLYERISRKHGIGLAEAHTLIALLNADGRKLHPSELCRHIGRVATGFTPTLDKLENGGYLTREPDQYDRRAVYVSLTESGNILAKKLGEEFSAQDKAILDLIGPQEKEVLKKIDKLLVAIATLVPQAS